MRVAGITFYITDDGSVINLVRTGGSDLTEWTELMQTCLCRYRAGLWAASRRALQIDNAGHTQLTEEKQLNPNYGKPPEHDPFSVVARAGEPFTEKDLQECLADMDHMRESCQHVLAAWDAGSRKFWGVLDFWQQAGLRLSQVLEGKARQDCP